MIRHPDLELADDEFIVGEAHVYRILQSDGQMRDAIISDDGTGEEIDLPTLVGMLAVAQHTILSDP